MGPGNAGVGTLSQNPTRSIIYSESRSYDFVSAKLSSFLINKMGSRFKTLWIIWLRGSGRRQHMASSFALIALFSLVLHAGITEARKDPGAYWQAVAKTEALEEAIDHLVHTDSSLSDKKKITSGCHTSNKDSATVTVNKRSFVTDFEPRPNASAYGDDAKQKEDKTFMKDFEPRPNLSVYDDDVGLKGEKNFDKDFEPRPNASVYQD